MKSSDFCAFLPQWLNFYEKKACQFRLEYERKKYQQIIKRRRKKWQTGIWVQF
jgi:hypothetical protein